MESSRAAMLEIRAGRGKQFNLLSSTRSWRWRSGGPDIVPPNTATPPAIAV